MEESVEKVIEQKSSENSKVGQEQIHDLLFGEKLSWQSIIYDLINTEQLDPWDIDISLLAEKYLERIRELEEANFFVSSKVLFAASLLLRIKSDILLSHEIPGLDEILFGKKDQEGYKQERIELDEEMPGLVPRTPLPRFKKVSLQELMSALGKAIKTENRRIKREIVLKQRLKEAEIVMPKNVYNLREKIRDVYKKLKNIFSNREEKLAFTELMEQHEKGDDIQEKIASFVSLLHLDNQQKVWLEQDGHGEEIFILLKQLYLKKNKALLELQEKEVARAEEEELAKLDALEKKHMNKGELEEVADKSKIDTGFSNEIEKEIED